MYCTHCNQPVQENSNFCNICGKPIPKASTMSHQAISENPQQYRDQEILAMQTIINHFSMKRKQFYEYDEVCCEISRDRGASKAMLIWGAILLGIAIVFSSLFMSEYEYMGALITAAIFGVPGAPLLIFGIKRVVSHNKRHNELLQKYKELSVELHNQYKACSYCPIPSEYMNPQILSLFYMTLHSGYANSIRDSVNLTLDHSRIYKAQRYLQSLRETTARCDLETGVTTHFVAYHIFR